MSKRVIHTLETVQIHIQDSDCFPGGPCVGEHCVCRFDAALTVGKAGEDIHVRETLDVLCGCGALTRILTDDYNVTTLASSEAKLVGVSCVTQIIFAILEAALFSIG